MTISRTESIALAVSHLNATSYQGETLFAYTETAGGSIVYLVNDEDMVELGDALSSGFGDAYSDWCSSCTATELTTEDVTIAYPSATDFDALNSEAGAAGDFLTCAVIDHLGADLRRIAAA